MFGICSFSLVLVNTYVHGSLRLHVFVFLYMTESMSFTCRALCGAGLLCFARVLHFESYLFFNDLLNDKALS